MQNGDKAGGHMSWEEEVMEHMIRNGWRLDYNTEEKFGFSINFQGTNFCRDYNKKTRRFVEINMDWITNLRVRSTKELSAEEPQPEEKKPDSQSTECSQH
jgi:hypothetical protein